MNLLSARGPGGLWSLTAGASPSVYHYLPVRMCSERLRGASPGSGVRDASVNKRGHSLCPLELTFQWKTDKHNTQKICSRLERGWRKQSRIRVIGTVLWAGVQYGWVVRWGREEGAI